MSDRILGTVGTLAFLVALVFACVAGGREADAYAKRRAAKLADARFGRSADVSALGDFLPQLPPGVRVDPETGLLLGVDLETEEGVRAVPWEMLRAYEYKQGLEGLPESIRQLDGQRVAMLGFVWPIFEYDDMSNFGLVGNHWSCCYGVPPGITDVAVVELRKDQPGLSRTLSPVRVEGIFHVRERKQDGYVVSLFDITDGVAVVFQ